MENSTSDSTAGELTEADPAAQESSPTMSSPPASTASQATPSADVPADSQMKTDGVVAPEPVKTPVESSKSEKTLIELMEDRLSYANEVLRNFEALRHNALFTKVPQPYQKRWQQDSNVFFHMAIRTLARIRKQEARIKGRPGASPVAGSEAPGTNI